MPNILIIDDPTGPSLSAAPVYSAYLSLQDVDYKLLIISTKINDVDRNHPKVLDSHCITTTSSGEIENIARRWYKLHGFESVYTRQEELVVRAGGLRQMASCSGLTAKESLVWRDKLLMKEHLALATQITESPSFEAYSDKLISADKTLLVGSVILSPCQQVRCANDLYTNLQSFPKGVVVKPARGSASASVQVIRNEEEADEFVMGRLFSRVDSSGRSMEYAGDLLIEPFTPGEMYHVNGHCFNGKITDECLFIFSYLSTNLGFTEGKAYGNVLIQRSESLFDRLKKAATDIIDNLPHSGHIVFHLELFGQKGDKFTFCEIAARRPGGSIGSLISLYLKENGASIMKSPNAADEHQELTFPQLEFRLANNLSVALWDIQKLKSYDLDNCAVGDMMVPRQKGILAYMPSQQEFDSFLKAELSENEEKSDASSCYINYIQIAEVGDKYNGFDINVFNVAARFVAYGRCTSNRMQKYLEKCSDWLAQEMKWTPSM